MNGSQNEWEWEDDSREREVTRHQQCLHRLIGKRPPQEKRQTKKATWKSVTIEERKRRENTQCTKRGKLADFRLALETIVRQWSQASDGVCLVLWSLLESHFWYI